MKALSIKQPWADAIVHGDKRVENRTRPAPPKYIGTRILIHSSLLGDRAAVLSGIQPVSDVRGAILGLATLASCHFAYNGCSENCTHWGQPQLFHWKLTAVTALAVPVPAKGALGFWTPPADVLTAVYQQVPELVR